MITIDKGIPVPTMRIRPSKYPWADMDVGDSFLVEATAEEMKARSASISRGATAAAKQLGRKFTVRKVDGGVRVWRTE
jgi:hypothetical protein